MPSTNHNPAYTTAQTIWNTLRYSSACIAIIAALHTTMVLLVLNLKPNPTPIIVGCITLTIYAGDRLADTDADAESNPQRTQFIRNHKQTLTITAGISYIIALLLATHGGLLTLALTLFPAVIWIMYTINWTPTNTTSILERMKKHLLINTSLVAIAWTATLVLLPVIYTNTTITPTAVLLLVYFGIHTAIGTEIANIGDIEADQTENIDTLPTTLGVRTTQIVLYAAGSGVLVLLTAAFTQGTIDMQNTLALTVGMLSMLSVVALLNQIEDPDTVALLGQFTLLPTLTVLLIPTSVF